MRTAKELGELILKGMPYVKERGYCLLAEGCGCALGMAIAAVYPPRKGSRKLTRAERLVDESLVNTGSSAQTSSDLLSIDCRLAERVNELHIDGNSALSIAEDLIGGKYDS